MSKETRIKEAIRSLVLNFAKGRIDLSECVSRIIKVWYKDADKDSPGRESIEDLVIPGPESIEDLSIPGPESIEEQTESINNQWPEDPRRQ